MSDEEKTETEAGADGGAKFEKTKEAVNEGLNAARERFREVASDARGRATQIGSGLREGADRAGEAARERYAQFSENVRDGYHKARKDFDGLSENVNEYVRDNPGKSVLTAAAAGFVIGLLMRGRRSDS